MSSLNFPPSVPFDDEMQARRRFLYTDESVALIVNQQQPVVADVDETKKYTGAPSGKWNLGGFLPKQLTQAVLYSPLQQLQQFHQQTVVPQFSGASPVRSLLNPQSYLEANGDTDDDENDGGKEPELEVMASRDRTLEFSNAIRTLQSRNIARAVNVRDAKKATQLQSYSEFMMIAKHVGKNIASTYSKLEKLTLCEYDDGVWYTEENVYNFLCIFPVAKRKSLFDDRPAEIQELTYIIKGDLNSLNQQIARLQEVSKSQRNSGKHLQSHSSNMVVALQAKLANMSTDFKQILEVRTENLKHQKNRRDQVGRASLADTLMISSSRTL